MLRSTVSETSKNDFHFIVTHVRRITKGIKTTACTIRN